MNAQEVLSRAYAAFNGRDIDGALALMSADVSWPKASEGGRVVGKQEIRAYWTRQWAEFDPRVNILQLFDREDGRTEVKVHQRVRTLGGDVLFDGEVGHVYRIRDGLIERMDIVDAEGDLSGQSAAFRGA